MQYINMYYLFIGGIGDEDATSNRTSFIFNNVKYLVRTVISIDSVKTAYGIYTFMNTLKCDSGYIKTGTIINPMTSHYIDDMITYERTAENLDTVKEYSVSKNSDLLFDSYFNELYDTYTNGGKFLTLNNNVLSDVYIFSFKLLPVTVDNLIQQNVDEYVKLNKYNIDTITTETSVIIAQFCDTVRLMLLILGGIMAEKRDSRYDSLSNLSIIQGKDNQVFRKKLADIRTGFESSLDIIKELETVIAPPGLS